MNFVVLFGPPAVGKMTVGNELAKLTGFRLFHNHMTIDLVLNFFEFGHPKFGKLVSDFRRRIFEETASSDLPGLIFTYVWAMDDERDKHFVDQACEIFRTNGSAVYFVELEADQATRLERNGSEFRLSQKPTKRDLDKSRENLLLLDEKYRMNSAGDFFYRENYLKLNNTHLTAPEAARKIVTEFGFVGAAGPGSGSSPNTLERK